VYVDHAKEQRRVVDVAIDNAELFYNFYDTWNTETLQDSHIEARAAERLK